MRTHLGIGRPGRRGVLAVGSLVLASALALSACSSSQSTSGSSATGTAGSGGNVSLLFYNQSRGQEKTLTKLAAQYSKDHGITITVETPGPTDFPAKLQAKAQSKDMPDIYSTLDTNLMAPYYKAGWAMDLTNELKGDWGKNFNPTVLQMSKFDDGNNLGVPAGTYAVYWDISTYGFFADPTKTGLSATAAPKTMPDLIAALKKANANGAPFTVAASQVPWLLSAYATNYMTDQQITDTFQGKASWQTDAWRKTFQLLVDLKNAGVIANNAIPGGNNDNPSAEKAFFNTRNVGVFYDASAAIGVAKSTAPDFSNYITFGVPAATDGSQTARAISHPGRGAVVNPKGKHAKEALAFVQWLTQPDQQKVFSSEVGMIPTNANLDPSSLSGPIAGLAASMSSASTVTASMATDVQSAIAADAQSLVLGEKSVDDALKDVQTAQDQSK